MPIFAIFLLESYLSLKFWQELSLLRIYVYENWPIKKAECQKLMLLNCGVEKTFESPFDCKEIQPVHPKGDQSWVFIGRTDAEAETLGLWPPRVA